MLLLKYLGEKVKTLNIKRITALAAGAALLGLGLAFAGPISFQNVPIISSQGQPVVQIVIGSTAQPSDGVAAGNIAAAIGNLAYKSIPVTASINATQAQSVLSVSVPSSSYTISNPQVWLNLSSSTTITGAHQFQALIGSVLNRGVTAGQPSYTKTLQTAASNYAYPNHGAAGYTLNQFPMDSPYTDAMNSAVPLSTEPIASTNGGGITFTTFSNNGDNLMRITNSELPTLLNNAGTYKENEYLWISGFPVFNQSKSPGSLMLESADGAYQAYFANPIPNVIASTNSVNNAQISLLGENWTILNYTPPTGTVTSTTTLAGGKIGLAASLTPTNTVYVGHNITSGPFTVELTDLGQPNAGKSPASLTIYYNGKPENITQIWPGTGPQKFNVTGHSLYINVFSTFAGLYAYQKWAKLQLYSDVAVLQNGQQFNKTNDPNWKTILEWTNTTSSGSAPSALSSIILYGDSSAAMNLQQGQSFQWITQPAAYKLTYTGQTLGAGSYDPVTFQSTSVTGPNEYYENSGGANNTVNAMAYNPINGNFVSSTVPSSYVNDTAINETAQLLTVTSSIPSAFSGSFGKTSTLVYDLTPYTLAEDSQINTLTVNAAVGAEVNVVITDPFNMINANTPETIYVDGQPFKFTTNTHNTTSAKFFQNITSIYPSNPIPGLTVSVYTENVATPTATGANVLMATLTSTSPLNPVIFYSTSTEPYMLTTSATANVVYSQPNQQNTNWVLAPTTATSALGGSTEPYFSYTIQEYPVPLSSSYTDTIGFNIVNSSKGLGANPFFVLNYSMGDIKDNVTYVSSNAGWNGISATSSNIPVEQGFITERGSKIVSITPSELSFDLAKGVDEMNFAVATAATATNTITGFKLCPAAGLPGIGVGQSLSTCGIQNATIAKVTANVTVAKSANYTITGIGNIKATPSVTTATEPVLLNNITTNPLVVLDSATVNPNSNLILIGSGYVNSLSKVLQTQQNITLTPTSAPIMQAYGNKILIAGYYANQTTAAANSFIQKLYALASS